MNENMFGIGFNASNARTLMCESDILHRINMKTLKCVIEGRDKVTIMRLDDSGFYGTERLSDNEIDGLVERGFNVHEFVNYWGYSYNTITW